MRIVFIGSGNVATHLAVALKASGNEIIQVYSRTFENAKILAVKTGAVPVNDIGSIFCDADLYIFSVKDDALPIVISQMPRTNGIWAHTAGSVPLNVFSLFKEKYGVIYPLQTFSKDRGLNFSEIPLFIEGDCDDTTRTLLALAKTISSNVQYLPGYKRLYLHLAAVFACNFANHMYALASDIVSNEDIQFDILKPLIAETAAKVMEMQPVAAQTGPAVRFDEKVMKKHLELIPDPMIREIYSLLSKSIHIHSV